MSRLLPSIAQAIQSRSRRHARADPVDGLMRIDIARKGWLRGLFMMEAVRGWPARA
jgi:hypothetical protein